MSKGTKAQPRAGAAAAEWVKVEDLKPWEANPRLNDGKAVEKVAESIDRFGFASPIVARKDGQIIAGHTRYKAATALGLKRVPVRYLEISETDARLLALADNRIGEIADWDESGLADVLRDLYNEGKMEDIDIAGFSASEVEDFFTDHFDIDVDAPSDPFAEIPEADDQIAFAFGEYRGYVSKALYKSFVAEYLRQQNASPDAPMLGGVLRSWLNV